MPLFGFGDIQFNKGSVTRKGPLGSLVDNRFESTTLRYPVDVGNYDKAHYMVFYIRQQNNTQFGGVPIEDENALNTAAADVQKNAFSQLNTSQSSQASNIGSKFGGELLNKLNDGLSEINKATGGALEGLTSAVGKAAGGVINDANNLFGRKTSLIGGNSAATQRNIDTSIKSITNKSFIKTTTLTTDAIALYMPETLQFSYTQNYDTAEFGSGVAGQLAAAGVSAASGYKEDGVFEALGALGKSGVLGIGSAVSGLVGNQGSSVAFQALAGVAKNPMLELIYKSPSFRTFQFDFMFYPRDEREALEVQKIIERFRFHQAPEIVKDAQGFLIPPSQFDIKFYYGGVQNPNIPSIATCILSTIDVNYAPNGWTAFEVPGENAPAVGRTGMPVSIQVTLQFQETTYLTKSDFKQDKDFSSQEFTRASQSGELR